MPSINLEFSINTILTVLFAFSSAVLVVILQRRTERLKIVESQLSQSKYKVYHELVSIFFDMLKDAKAQRPLDIDALTIRMMDLKKDLLIYGSDKILLKLSEWLQYTGTHPNDASHIWLYLDALLLVRRDMGNRRTKITKKDIMLLIMQSEQEYEQLRTTL